MAKKYISLVHPELCYRIVGKAFDVYNEIGYGHKELIYQKALAQSFSNSGVKFKEQVYSPLVYQTTKVGRYFLDFLVEDKIVVELKAGEKFLKKNIGQVYSYLKANNLQLGILINFTKEGVKFRRIVNLEN